MVVQSRVVFGQADITATAIGSILFTEVSDQHPAPADSVFLYVIYYPIHPVFETFFTLFISRAGDGEVFDFLPCPGIDDEWRLFMWNIIDDPVFGKSDQYVIYFLLAQSGSGGDQPFINIYIIGKQSGISCLLYTSPSPRD